MAEQFSPAIAPTITPTAARGPVTQAVLTDPAQASDANPRVLARIPDLATGLGTLGRLTTGDQSVLARAGVQVQGRYDTQVHEWALGRLRTGAEAYFLISGGPTKVNWASPTLADLFSIGHTHPRHAIDSAAVSAQLGKTLIEALNAWLATYSKMTISAMPGDLWYLFPSNQDVIASYYTERTTPEVVFSPYRRDDAGRLSTTEGGVVYVEYGPVKATMQQHSKSIIKGADLMASGGMKRTEEACLQYLWCPVRFFVGSTAVLSAFMQVNPASGSKPTAPEFAWFRPTGAPDGAMTRAEAQHFIYSTAGL